MRWIVTALLLAGITIPVIADEGTQQTEPEAPAAEETAEKVEEVKGKVDSMEEAFVEARNTIDALKKVKWSLYLQAQYVDDQRSEDEIANGQTRNRDQFSIRRGRLKLTYEVSG